MYIYVYILLYKYIPTHTGMPNEIRIAYTRELWLFVFSARDIGSKIPAGFIVRVRVLYAYTFFFFFLIVNRFELYNITGIPIPGHAYGFHHTARREGRDTLPSHLMELMVNFSWS